jgi:hypothetical protein
VLTAASAIESADKVKFFMGWGPGLKEVTIRTECKLIAIGGN